MLSSAVWLHICAQSTCHVIHNVLCRIGLLTFDALAGLQGRRGGHGRTSSGSVSATAAAVGSRIASVPCRVHTQYLNTRIQQDAVAGHGMQHWQAERRRRPRPRGGGTWACFQERSRLRHASRRAATLPGKPTTAASGPARRRPRVAVAHSASSRTGVQRRVMWSCVRAHIASGSSAGDAEQHGYAWRSPAAAQLPASFLQDHAACG